MRNFILLALCAVLFGSCATSVTRGEQYAGLYEEKPVSVLVMPPINNTTKVEAKEYFYNSLARPLCEKGYYVVSPLLAMDLLKQESAYDSERFIDGNLGPFNRIFGADVAVFTIINKWKKLDLVNMISVEIEYVIRSTKTNEVLFNRVCSLDVNCGSNSSGSIFGVLANIIETALTDKIIAARRCNFYVLDDMPVGKYSPDYCKDMKVPVGKRVIKGSVKK